MSTFNTSKIEFGLAFDVHMVCPVWYKANKLMMHLVIKIQYGFPHFMNREQVKKYEVTCLSPHIWNVVGQRDKP